MNIKQEQFGTGMRFYVIESKHGSCIGSVWSTSKGLEIRPGVCSIRTIDEATGFVACFNEALKHYQENFLK